MLKCIKMSDIWRFSQSSEPLLRRLLETVNTLDDNEWSEKFKQSTEACRNYFNDPSTVISINYTAESSEGYKLSATCEIEEMAMDTNVDMDFCNCIEAEPFARLDYMTEQCLKRPYLVANLAEHLSVNAVEKLFNAILTRVDLDLEFIALFIQTFFPIFLKREQSLLAFDLLLKTNRVFPDPFQPLLLKLIGDVNIPNSVLQELLQSSIELQNDFMSSILHMNFTKEMFKHHLYTLYLVYKDCIKSEHIQNYMQSKLIENASNCANEKNYGRLLLSFLQAQKCLKLTTDCAMLQRVVEQHKTLFKKPCMTILNEIEEREKSLE